MFKVDENKLVNKIAYYLFFIIVFWVSYLLYNISNTIAGIVLMIYSCVQYIIVVKKNRALLDLKAIFLLTWCFSLGLAMLRLLGYQFVWSNGFFVAQFVGCITLIIAIDIGHILVVKKNIYGDEKHSNNMLNQKIYHFVLLCTFISIICYILNYLTVGFIPLFHKSANAYIYNTSKYMTIEIGMAPVSGIAYYCLTREGVTFSKKIILWTSIALNMLIFPILNLSRGNLVANLCMFFPAFYFCTKNIKKSLIKIGIVTFIGLILLTSKRDFSSSYNGLQISDKYSDNEDLMMSYAYLTCSHDNFALNIQNFDAYTNGLRMFNIFNEILDNETITSILKSSKLLWVNSFLNTQDMFGFFYYDIGFFGIIVWSLLWGIIWGKTEKEARVNPTPISYIVFGITFYCVAFAFFSSKTGFVTVMWYGMAYLGNLFTKIKQ